MPKHGTSHPNARFTPEEVKTMTDLRRKGLTLREIADRFNITHPSTVYNITSGRGWKHLDVDWIPPGTIRNRRRGEDHHYSKLNVDQIKQIVEMDKEGKHQYEIADTVGVTSAAICSILNGRSWQHVTSDLMKHSKKSARQKLSDRDVKEMRKKYDAGIRTGKIAEEFGVSLAYASRVIHKRARTNVSN